MKTTKTALLSFASLVSLATWLSPALALACPGYAGAHGGAACCGASHFGEYMAAVGIGLLAGLGSVALEGILKGGGKRT